MSEEESIPAFIERMQKEHSFEDYYIQEIPPVPCDPDGIYGYTCNSCANEECKKRMREKNRQKSFKKEDIEQGVTDAQIVFGKFCCKICTHYDTKNDKCLKTGDTNIKWRAHRTCCGIKEWHVPRKSTTDYA